MSIQRIYRITNKTSGATTLVRASTQAQALRFVASDTFSIDVASGIEVADAMTAGAKVLVITEAQEQLDV